jgi:adenylate cyclase
LQGKMAAPEQPTPSTRELAAIMFSDVVGYTAIMGRDENEALRALDAHRELLRGLLTKFNGRMVGEVGDGTLTAYHSAIDAVNCAREVQALADGNPEVRLRIGIHLGDVVFTNNTVVGDGVNVASRIHSLAPPGGICVSEHVYDEIRNKPGMPAKDLGRKRLKNVSRPIRVYALQASATAEAVSFVPRITGRQALIGGALSAVAIVLGVAFASRERIMTAFRPAPVAAGKTTVAVLPFANLSADKQDEYFSDGMTDEIIGDLSKLSGLQVAARTSSFAFKGKNEDAKKIAELLQVRNLLEGSVRRSADKLRIEVQLVDASSGFTLWSQRFDEEANDVFQIQSEVAESVAEKLKVRLLAEERERVEKKPTQNLEAYDLYLQGRYYLSQFSEDGWKRAVDDFNQAIAKDPNFAAAYEGLGETYGWESAFLLQPREAIPKAKALFQHALALDDNLASAHGAMADMVLFGYEWNWPAAEREFQRALELDSSNAQIHEQYGDFLVAMGRFDEAIREKLYARELNPLQVQTLVDIGMVYRDSRNYERSYEYSQQAIRMAPNYWAGYWVEGWSGFSQKDYTAAVNDFQKAESLAHYPATKGALAMVYAVTGRTADALRLLAELKELSTHRYVDPTVFVSVYAGLGDKDEAFRWLDKAYEGRSFFLVMMNMPQWDGLRSDPRFQAMLKKVGLPPLPARR